MTCEEAIAAFEAHIEYWKDIPCASRIVESERLAVAALREQLERGKQI